MELRLNPEQQARHVERMRRLDSTNNKMEHRLGLLDNTRDCKRRLLITLFDGRQIRGWASKDESVR